MKPTVVVADSSPLIALAVMDLIAVLPKLFTTVYIPPSVVQECTVDISKPKAAIIKDAITKKYLLERSVTSSTLFNLLSQILDEGEAEAIALAKELQATALVDEKMGRKIAGREGVNCVGSMYCLILSKKAGLIGSAKEKLEILSEHGYYLKPSLLETVLKNCDEL